MGKYLQGGAIDVTDSYKVWCFDEDTHFDPTSRVIPHMSANMLEFFGQLTAVRLSAHIPTDALSYSDCKSVVSSLTEALSFNRRPMGHTAKGICYESVATSEGLRRPPRNGNLYLVLILVIELLIDTAFII